MQSKYIEQQKESIVMNIESIGEELLVSLQSESGKMITDVSIGVFDKDGYLVQDFENPIKYNGTSIKIPTLKKGEYCVGLYDNKTEYKDPPEYQIIVDTKQVVKEVTTIDAVIENNENETNTTKIIAIAMMCCAVFMFIMMVVLRIKRRKAEENV